MTPDTTTQSNHDQPRAAGTLDLQAAYLVLIRAWMRQHGASGERKHVTPGPPPPLP